MNPLDQLENFFAEVVRQMPNNVFDSHAFILKLVKTPPRQRIYVEALAATTGRDPFRQVHKDIAKRLKRHSDLVVSRGRVSSDTIFGDDEENEQWERL